MIRSKKLNSRFFLMKQKGHYFKLLATFAKTKYDGRNKLVFLTANSVYLASPIASFRLDNN